MEKIKRLSALLLFLSAFSFVSCDTEPVDPVLLDNVNNPEDPGTNPDNPTNPGTSDGSYWPMALNNEWVFDVEDEGESPMKITNTETIEGNTYYKINYTFANSGTGDLTGEASNLIRHNNGDYSVRVSAVIPDQEGVEITVTPFEYTILKDYLEAGQTWTQDVQQTSTYQMPGVPIPPMVMNFHMENIIQEKGITMQVNGVSYENVIKVKQTQTITSDLTPTTVLTVYYWFAKDVGPIKSESQTSNYSSSSTLVSYTLN